MVSEESEDEDYDNADNACDQNYQDSDYKCDDDVIDEYNSDCGIKSEDSREGEHEDENQKSKRRQIAEDLQQQEADVMKELGLSDLQSQIRAPREYTPDSINIGGTVTPTELTSIQHPFHTDFKIKSGSHVQFKDGIL